MPDFAAFLQGFVPRFSRWRLEGYAVDIDDEGITFVRREDGSGLQVVVMDKKVMLCKDKMMAAVSNLRFGY
jgi:hypothetical protein